MKTAREHVLLIAKGESDLIHGILMRVLAYGGMSVCAGYIAGAIYSVVAVLLLHVPYFPIL